VEVRGQLHAPVAFTQEKRSPCTHWIGGWTGPLPIATPWRTEKSLFPFKVSNPFHPASSLVTIWTQVNCKICEISVRFQVRCLIFTVCPTILQRNIYSKFPNLIPCSLFLLVIVELLILRSFKLPWIIMNKMLNKITIHILGFVPSSFKIIPIMFYAHSSNTFNKVMIYF
jgi:hypothetical protein